MENRYKHGWTAGEVLAALHRNEFVPFFQPKVDLVTGQCSSVEILARWIHPKFGTRPPCEFINVIEHLGLIDWLTNSLLEQALISAQHHGVNGSKIGMALNVSPQSLANMQTSQRICAMVRDYGLSSDQITIELTEGSEANEPKALGRSLHKLRAEGFHISVDDFGTGYSSLKLLSQIPCTELKIDRMFVAGIDVDRKLTNILESIVDLANKLDLRLVAEGIEVQPQLDFVRGLGCGVGQGYYWSEPVRSLEQTIIQPPGITNRRTDIDFASSPSC
jgi:EAL domain-containing protein (putative c-di-GMP-specific phosphodiesterase class I)